MILRKRSNYPSQLDSPFQLQEHLQALYHHHTKSDQTNTTMALSRDTAQIIATPPEGIDKSLWLYELCRLLVLKANSLIVAFFDERPPCSSSTCPEMRASEWQYLCAVHDPPKSCCAIDYCCHTLDWAANVLTSQKNFPSRLTLGSETTGGSQQGIRHLTNIFRRVYRIFAHAWFQHRQSFWEVEGKEGIYILFKTVCDSYSLIPEENYTISPEAEGISASPEEEKEEEKESKSILRKKEGEDSKPEESNAIGTNSLAATTKRHKHTPSTGFTTIAEGGEEEELKSGSDSDASGTTSTSPPSAGKRLHKHTQSVIPAVPTIAEMDEEENKKKSHPLSQQLDKGSDGTTSTLAKTAQPTEINEPLQASEKAETNSSRQPAAEEKSAETYQTKLADAPLEGEEEGEEEAPPVPPKLEERQQEREQEQEKLEEPPSKASEVEELKPA